MFNYQDTQRVSLIDYVFGNNRFRLPTTFRMVLICLLVQVDTAVGKQKVVHVLSHRRSRYSLSVNNYFNTVLVDSVSMVQTVMIVVDPYCLPKTHGAYKRFQGICDETDRQLSIKLLAVKGFPLYKRKQRLGFQFS